VVLAALVFPGLMQREFAVILIGGFVIVLLGTVDDLRPLPWQLRLAVQAITAIAVVSIWPSPLSWGLRAVSAFWLVALINAFNMLDNMDALSAGTAWIAAGMLALGQIIVGPSEQWTAAMPYIMLMGALWGFLWFNRPPARIFMGDAGSTFLGFFLGVGSLHDVFADQAHRPWEWAMPVFVLAVPWYDLCTVVALRLWQGHSPFHADKQHLSHRLVSLGLKSSTAVYLIHLFGVVSGAAGVCLLMVSGIGRWLITLSMLSFWAVIAGIEYFRHFSVKQAG
jgi:UDP-GlcNAc:undecaprenyl-phosphate GlcNAc-1-phosphate transferase